MTSPTDPMIDPTRGYESAAADYAAYRSPKIGVTTVARWAASLPAGAPVLDLGCGTGLPITRTLVDRGLDVWAMDASPSMVAAFRRNFPGLPVACEAVERSELFSRRFDAAIAWGLLFLLEPAAQAAVIRKIAKRLSPAGRLLFTSPAAAGEWIDALTGTRSVSLGREGYRELLSSAGLVLSAEYDDEGDNHYFDASKTEGTRA